MNAIHSAGVGTIARFVTGWLLVPIAFRQVPLIPPVFVHQRLSPNANSGNRMQDSENI